MSQAAAPDWTSIDLTSVAGAARSYTQLRLRVIPLHAPVFSNGSAACTCGKLDCGRSIGKHPIHRSWEKLTLGEADLGAHFDTEQRNLGVRLGEPSGGLIDVDLDCPEALAMAPAFLPSTECAFGRSSTPESHPLYSTTPAIPSAKFVDADDQMLAEIRSTKSQTVFPPSVHHSGEQLAFARLGPPAVVDGADLKRRVGKLAAACLVLRGWPRQKGGRWMRAHALAGGLLRAGWDPAEIKDFIRVIATAANDDEVEARVQAVDATAEKIACGEETTGWPQLGELIGQAAVQLVCKYLGVRASRVSGPPRSTSNAARGVPHYSQDGTGLVYLKPTPHGSVPVPLTNFTATIITDIVEDDGVEKRRVFEMDAALGGGEPTRLTIPAEEFSGMKWPLRHLGPKAVLFPGQSSESHSQAAIQLLSQSIETRTVYTHTGWRKLGDAWEYLHGGGAIGAAGLDPSVQTGLPSVLEHFRLPGPPEGEALTTAVQAQMRFLTLGHAYLTYPLIASMIRAVLGDADFSDFVVGPTGKFKTETAALIQQHFGSGFDARHLPGSWSSTANSLEDLAFRAKDAVLVVDDFKPAGDAVGDSKLHQQADRLLRAQGNRSGRLRMRADGSLRPARPPRGLILSTGEEIPRGESLRARALIFEIGPGDIDVAALTACQRAAAAGLYEQAMSGFLRWCASRLDSLRAQFGERARTLRASFGGGHARLPVMLAELFAAFEVYLRFVVEATAEDALTRAEAEDEMEACRGALVEIGRRQVTHQKAAEPTARFRELLGSAIISGRGHVAGPEGTEPANSSAWGWRLEGSVARPMGDRVGWVQGDDLFLDPTASYKAAQGLAQGADGIAIGEKTLRKRLSEKGLLVTTEPGRETLTVRKGFEGRRQSVLHLRADFILGRGEADDGDPDPAIPV